MSINILLSLNIYRMSFTSSFWLLMPRFQMACVFNKTILRGAAFLIIWIGSSKQIPLLLQREQRVKGVWNLGSGLKGNRAHEIWVTMPQVGLGVSPHHHPFRPWTWNSSSRPSGACTATAPWMWGRSSRLPPLASVWGSSSGHHPWPWAGVALPSCHPWPRTWGSS